MIFFSILFFIGTFSQANPKNYDECILENISKAKNNAALVTVKKACENLFPKENKKEEFVLPKPIAEVKKLYLANVNSRLEGSRFYVEIINDTDHFISQIFLQYKEGGCEKPTAAATLLAQKQLNRKKFDAGKADGVWGNKTKKAVSAFQKTNRLKISGELVNSDTSIHLYLNFFITL